MKHFLSIVAAAPLALLAFCPTPSRAERVILTPSADTLAPSQLSVEEAVGIDRRLHNLLWLNGESNQFELEVARFEDPHRQDFAVSVQMEFLPETFQTPAVSVGVRDLLNSGSHFAGYSSIGRSFYLAAGKSIPGTERNAFLLGNAYATIGLGTGVERGLFGSLSADLALGLRQTLEFDGRNLNYRVSHSLGSIARLEYDRIHGANFFGLSLTTPARL